MKFDTIIIRYGEIALKGGNRIYFEKKLIENIKKHLIKSKIKYEKIIRKEGRILIKAKDKKTVDEIKNILGIISFSPAKEIGWDIENIKKHALQEMKNYIKENPVKTFRVTTQRLDKKYKIKNPEVSRIAGEEIFENTNLKVKLKDFDVELMIELIDGKAYIFLKKIEGQKGLPFGISGKIISLISDGIDSPVASYLMMKRGCRPVFLNFEQSKKGTEKVKRIIKQLEKYSPEKLELMILNHKKELEETIKNLEATKKRKWTCIFCKRMMIKKAQELAGEKNADGIVTGEQLAQVASQTLPNQKIIKYGFEIPVYEPLIGLDKQDSVDIAKKIGTFVISEEKSSKCIFLPGKVEIKAKTKDFLMIKKKVEG